MKLIIKELQELRTSLCADIRDYEQKISLSRKRLIELDEALEKLKK